MSSLSLATVETSNLPAAQKSSIRRLYERMGGSASLTRAKMHVAATGHAVRQVGESAVVGAALGALSQTLPGGLDHEVQGHKIPLDLVGGSALVGASVLLAHEDYATDLRNAGAMAIGIGAFRKTAEFVAAKKGVAPRFAGEFEFGSEGGGAPASDKIASYWARHHAT